jgi:hypothetical protein
MTNIINFDIKQLIEKSISELTKNLSDDIEIKVRNDITNKILETKSSPSIFGLDDIKEFAKIKPNSGDKYLSDNCQSYGPRITTFSKDEYPIIIYNRWSSSNCSYYYETNMYNNKIMNNDMIFISLLIFNNYSKAKDYSHEHNGGSSWGSNLEQIVDDQFIFNFSYLGLKTIPNGLRNDYNCEPKREFDALMKYNYKKLINYYFDAITDYKIKAIEYDKIKNIQDKTSELTEQLSDMQNKYSELEAKYKELEEYNTMLIMQNRLLNK